MAECAPHLLRSPHLMLGISNTLRFIPCHSIASRIGDGVCKALPAYHAISGCDSTSALSGVGKKKGLKLFSEDQGVQDTLSLVGVQPRMAENMLQDTDTCICQMYGAACASLKTADETRYWMF
jgi:5'-3' exonuclease